MNEFFDVDLEQQDTSELEVQLNDASGVPAVTFTLVVAGANSAVYAAAIDEARASAKKLARKRGVETLAYADQQDIVRLRAARCIVGWTGIKKPWSKSAALELLERYPAVVGKVVAHTDAEENFMRISGSAS